ncbi:MAG: hypothetical protein C0623_12435 [Desulfuromonas sp.]|nr:MAG: hypothetical protein C0623_12435 [Desulfuromonas sp.]
MKKFVLSVLVLVFALAACALPPEKAVTREDLMRTGIYQKFIIEESPEQIVDMLNTYGEAILQGKRNVPGKDYPVNIKMLATAEGIELLDYDR